MFAPSDGYVVNLNNLKNKENQFFFDNICYPKILNNDGGGVPGPLHRDGGAEKLYVPPAFSHFFKVLDC